MTDATLLVFPVKIGAAEAGGKGMTGGADGMTGIVTGIGKGGMVVTVGRIVVMSGAVSPRV